MYLWNYKHISFRFSWTKPKREIPSQSQVEHLKERCSNLMKPKSRTSIGKKLNLAWNLKEYITNTWGQMLKITSTFLWRERRGSLAQAHGGEDEKMAKTSNWA